MQILSVQIPELGTYVRFKQFSPDSVLEYEQKYNGNNISHLDWKKKVIGTFIYNVNTEISASLKMMSKKDQDATVEALYNGVVMLNPGLDVNRWVALAFKINDYVAIPDSDVAPQEALTSGGTKDRASKAVANRSSTFTKEKFLGLESFLLDNVVGQQEAVTSVVKSLKRFKVGLSDPDRPIGIFLLAGASGVGKTHLAKCIHRYLFGKQDIVRVDCGEYRERHQAVNILGSPKSYVGYDEGSALARQVRKNPHTVILLDEVEKAHPEFWNIWLRIFDEGKMTDSKGKEVDFSKAIFFMTTNLGNDQVVSMTTGRNTGFVSNAPNPAQRIIPARESVERITLEAVSKHFKPEFLNRIDSKIIFNFLETGHYKTIAEMELIKVSDKLSKRGVTLLWDNSVVNMMVNTGVDTISNARGISGVRRNIIEDLLADKILSSSVIRGSVLELTSNDAETLICDVITPVKKLKAR